MWALRGLRDGVVTTRWPTRPDPYAAVARGPATVLNTQPASADDRLDRLCPTGAISRAERSGGNGSIHLDQGKCVQCGRCVEARPDVFGWSEGPGAAALWRGGLMDSEFAETPERLAAVRDGLKARTAALRRSVHLRHVDAGSDGTEEWEILALFNPVYDVHRLGIFLTASPRHADILLNGVGGEPGSQTSTGTIAPIPPATAYDGLASPPLTASVPTATTIFGAGMAS